MCNANFSLGFEIDRERLHQNINQQTEYISIFEPSDAYVGVNIKIPVREMNLEDEPIISYTATDNPFDLRWTEESATYGDYLKSLNVKDREKKRKNGYNNTFLVFYSGKAIMSGGISSHNRRVAFETFIQLIHKFREDIIVSYNC
jgi:hypothetical protein